MRSRPVEVPPGGLVIGSDAAECGLCLNAAFFIAPRHVRFFSQGDSWFLRRLDTRLHTVVNGRKLAADETVEVRENDIIELGFVIFLAHSGAADDGPAEGETGLTAAGPPAAPADAGPGEINPAEAAPRLTAAQELAAILGEPGAGAGPLCIDDLLPNAAPGEAGGYEGGPPVFSPEEFPGSFTPEAGAEDDDILAGLARESEEAGQGGAFTAAMKAPEGKAAAPAAGVRDPLRLLDVMEGLSVTEVLEGPLTIDAILESLDTGRPPALLETAPPDPDPLTLVGGPARGEAAPAGLTLREYRRVKMDAHYLSRARETSPKSETGPGKETRHDDDQG